jgi:hypothetical protein
MIRAIIIGITTLFLLVPGFAAEPAKSQSHTFFGVKGGLMKPDGSNTDSAGNIGVVMGQPVARYFSWEAELNATLFDGKVGTDNNWDINTLAGYAVFRSEGNIGLKAKAGLAYWDTGSNDDFSLSLGIGAGFKMGKSGMLDVEYTQIDDSVDYISVGYIFNF